MILRSQGMMNILMSKNFVRDPVEDVEYEKAKRENGP